MNYANGIEFAGRYEVIFIGTQAKEVWLYCNYKGRGFSIQDLDHMGQLSLAAGALSINVSLKNSFPFVENKQKKPHNN